MDPKWHPSALMGLGAVLIALTYITSLMFVQNTLQAAISFMMMAVAALTLASGVVLAFFMHFRKEVPRFRR